MSLRLRGFRATQEMLRRRLARRQKDGSKIAAPPFDSASEAATWTARMVRAAVRYGFGHPTCLEESLTLWWLLGRQGIHSHLRIGIRKEHEKFEAHAWVECDGLAGNDQGPSHHHYAAFDASFASLPPEER